MAEMTNGSINLTMDVTVRRLHPAGGVPNARVSYGVPGVPGIVVFDLSLVDPAWLAANPLPATLTIVGLPLAQPRIRAAHTTSAVIAAATVATAQAQGNGTVIATPAQVAQVAQVAGAVVTAAAAAPAAAAPAAAAPAATSKRK